MLEELMERLVNFLAAILLMGSAGCAEETTIIVETSACFAASATSQIEVAGYAQELDLQLTAPAGTAYSISVLTGEEWCLLSKQGSATTKEDVMALSSRIETLYLRANATEQEREAEIAVRFSTEEQVLLTLRQAVDDKPALYTRNWPEVPAYRYEEHCVTVTHFAPLSSSVTARNITLNYDQELRYAKWVAYPLHSCYMNGTYNRTDDWAYDPKIPIEDQANLASGSYRNSWVRGHQAMSNHRYVNYSDELNAQTFYSTNIMPQHYDFNGGLWNEMEGVCTAKARNIADTLYCVTGAHGVQCYTTDRGNKQIAVPEYCYKVMLRTRSGKTYRPIAEITDPAELIAIGYWAPNSAAGNTGKLTDFTMSVREVEELSGYTFFPMLNPAVAEAVKNQHNPSDWGIR